MFTDYVYVILGANPVGNVTFWGWLMLALGVVADLSSHAQSYASRDRGARAVYSPAT